MFDEIDRYFDGTTINSCVFTTTNKSRRLFLIKGLNLKMENFPTYNFSLLLFYINLLTFIYFMHPRLFQLKSFFSILLFMFCFS